MACRLNPSLAEGIKTIISAIGAFSIGLIVIITYWSLLIGLVWSIIHQLELYDLCAQVASASGVYDTLLSYELDAASGVIAIFHLTILSIFIVIVVVTALFSEVIESYSYKKRQLEYKFQGKQMPWYRVLTSYIIVCDGR